MQLQSGCGRPCDHAATSRRTFDSVIDKVMTVLRSDFAAFYAPRPLGR